MWDIYVAGPMTGIVNKNYEAFNKAADSLRKAGYAVINPAELDSADSRDTWEESLRRDIDKLIQCKYIATLAGWKYSRGAKLEVYIGMALGMKIKPVKGFLKERRVK
jgi:hypothetical protein